MRVNRVADEGEVEEESNTFSAVTGHKGEEVTEEGFELLGTWRSLAWLLPILQ